MLPPALLAIAVPLITFLLLIGVGSSLATDDVRQVGRRPMVVVAGLLVPPLVLPAMGVALIAWLEPPAAIASGLLLIAICPVGGLSTTLTYLAGGSAALAVTLTASSCILAVVTIPALTALLAQVTSGTSPLVLPPALLLVQLLATVVLPVLLGMLVRHRWPRFADASQLPLRRTGFALLGLLLSSIILSDTRGFVDSLRGAIPVAALWIAASMVVGGGVGHVLGAGVRERIALAVEFATRNVAVASTLALSAGRLEFATFATTYFLTELPLMMAAAAVFRVLLVNRTYSEPTLKRPIGDRLSPDQRPLAACSNRLDSLDRSQQPLR